MYLYAETYPAKNFPQNTTISKGGNLKNLGYGGEPEIFSKPFLLNMLMKIKLQLKLWKKIYKSRIQYKPIEGAKLLLKAMRE